MVAERVGVVRAGVARVAATGAEGSAAVTMAVGSAAAVRAAVGMAGVKVAAETVAGGLVVETVVEAMAAVAAVGQKDSPVCTEKDSECDSLRPLSRDTHTKD